MSGWWQSLPAVLQVFYGVALLGSVILVFQTILLLIGSGHADFGDAGHGDVGGGDNHGGLGMLSLRTIVAFCTGFGWTGVIITRHEGPLWFALAAGLAAGLILAWSVLWMMRSMLRMGSDGSLDYKNAVGAVGTVIVAIQPDNRAGGQVEVLVQGRLAAVQAIGTGAATIASGTKVRITELVSPTTLRVTPI